MKIEAIPNFMAPVYALIARKNPVIKDIYAEVAQEVCSKMSSGRILDVGTGPGYLPIEIAAKSPGLEVVGVDLSSKMVDIATNNARGKGVSGRVHFDVANAGALPYANESFDFIISTLSLHHWSDPKSYIKELYRVLKKNGQIAIYDLWRDTPVEVESQIKKKYGQFTAFLMLKFVRLHSSISLKIAQDIVAAVDVKFSEKRVDTRGVVVILRMKK